MTSAFIVLSVVTPAIDILYVDSQLPTHLSTTFCSGVFCDGSSEKAGGVNTNIATTTSVHREKWICIIETPC